MSEGRPERTVLQHRQRLYDQMVGHGVEKLNTDVPRNFRSIIGRAINDCEVPKDTVARAIFARKPEEVDDLVSGKVFPNIRVRAMVFNSILVNLGYAEPKVTRHR